MFEISSDLILYVKNEISNHGCHTLTIGPLKVSRRVRDAVSELESLAINPKRLNELNDAYEMEDLVDNIKLNLYQEYKSE